MAGLHTSRQAARAAVLVAAVMAIIAVGVVHAQPSRVVPVVTWPFILMTSKGTYGRALACVTKARSGCTSTYSAPLSGFILGRCHRQINLKALRACVPRGVESVLDLSNVMATRTPDPPSNGSDFTLDFENKRFWEPKVACNPPAGASTPFERAKFFCYQWGAKSIGAPTAWKRGITGKGITVAVPMGRFQCNHPDLVGKLDLRNGRVFLSYDAAPPNLCTTSPTVMFPTSLATLIAGRGVGIAGVAPGATILPIVVFSDDQIAWAPDLLQGILYAASKGANVINLSFTSIFINPNATTVNPAGVPNAELKVFAVNAALTRVYAEAERLGSLIVQSSGGNNETLSSARSTGLANLPHTIVVGATNPDSAVPWCPTDIARPSTCSTNSTNPIMPRAPLPPRPWGPFEFQVIGPDVDIMAPGGGDFPISDEDARYCAVRTFPFDGNFSVACPDSTFLHQYTLVGWSGGRYVWDGLNGYGAPHVSGAVALLLERYPALRRKPRAIRARLMQTASKVYGASKDYGAGYLNIAAALGL